MNSSNRGGRNCLFFGYCRSQAARWMYEQLYLVWDGADLRLGKHGRVLATVVPVVGWANMWVCQRRSKNASAGRSKSTSAKLVRRPAEPGALGLGIRLGSDYPPAYPSWQGVGVACSD
jgi:hypothetical protein